MQVDIYAGIEISDSVIRLIDRQPLRWVISRGVARQPQRELELWSMEFENCELTIVEDRREAAELIRNRPEWRARLSGQIEKPDSIGAAIENLEASQGGLTSLGIPVAYRADVQAKISRLEAQGVLERYDQTNLMVPPAENKNLLLQGKAQGGGVLELLIITENLCLLDLKSSNPRLEHYSSLEQLETAIEERSDNKQTLAAKSPPEKLSLQPLGGIGELKGWQAYLPGSTKAASEEEAAKHPISDWLPGSSGAICRERGEGQAVDALRTAAQVYLSGRFIHSGYAPQERRLGQNMKALDIYRPANPYGPTPAPMARCDD